MDKEKIRKLFFELLESYESLKREYIYEYAYDEDKGFKELEKELKEYKEKIEKLLGK